LTEDLDLLLNRIGLRLTRRRQELGLSQRALAGRLGITGANITRIENGQQNVTIGTLHRIATELDMTVEELIVEEPQSTVGKR
jgi:transcriptional regulator with XRE-family HTH domain